PRDYKAGMEKLLAEELSSERMRYTLELKEKQVKQSELEAQADKVRRETAATAAGEEQIIAAWRPRPRKSPASRAPKLRRRRARSRPPARPNRAASWPMPKPTARSAS